MYKFQIYHEAVGYTNLEHAPKGWDAMEYVIKRDEVYHGMTLDFTADLTFVKDGFDVVHSLYEAYGVEANVLLFVYEQNPLSLRYNLVYVGLIALEGWSVRDYPREGTANVDLAGFQQRFLNAEDTEVGLQHMTGLMGQPLPALATRRIPLHSAAIWQDYHGEAEIQATGTGYITKDDIERSLPNGDDSAKQLLFGFDKVHTNSLKVFTYQTGFLNTSDDAPVLEVKANGSYTIEFNIRGTMTLEHQGGPVFQEVAAWVGIRKNNEAPIKYWTGGSDNLRYGIFPAYKQRDWSAKYSAGSRITMDLKAGDKLYVTGNVKLEGATGAAGRSWNQRLTSRLDKGSFLKINASGKTEGSESDCVMVHEAFARICTSYTGYASAFYSDYFGRTDSFPRQYPKDGPGSMMGFLNGFMARGYPSGRLPTEDTDAAMLKRNLYMSFKDLFEAMNCIRPIGMSFERVHGELVVRVEEREFFYRKGETILELGKVSNLERINLAEHYHNECAFGYKDWQTEDDSGLSEFNAEQYWTLPVTRQKSKYNNICSFSASGYRLELVRREPYKEAETKDNKDDDTTFIVCLERMNGKIQPEKNAQYPVVTGVHQPDTAYNLRITPANMLHNHLPILRVCFYKKTEGAIRFNKGEGNYKVRTVNIEGDEVVNGANVNLEDMPEALFIPEEYSFEHPLNHQELKMLRENPYGLIRFRDSSGAVLAGFVKEVRASAVRGMAQFVLIRA